jgi:hypothetical protein
VKKLFQITCNAGRETIQPVLSFRVGARHFSYSVSDHSSGELKQLVYYSGNELDEHFLQQLLTSHSELSAPYYQVLVCFDHTQNTFVPLKHYNHEDASVHLKTLFDVNGGYTVVSESVPEWQMYNIYAVPAQVYEWFRRKYMAARVWHQGSIGIKKLNISTSPAQMLVDFRIDDFTVMAFERNNLLLAQSYNYSTPEDVLYQLLKICGQLGFSTESVQVALSGLIDRESALYKDLYLYFLHAGFRDAEWKVDSKDYPAHFFTSLNDLARCAS